MVVGALLLTGLDQVALNNGTLIFSGSSKEFNASDVAESLAQSSSEKEAHEADKQAAPDAIIETHVEEVEIGSDSDISSTAVHSSEISESQVKATPETKKKPRKLVEEEKRVVGRVKRDVWETYVKACGGWWYWLPFLLIMLFATFAPVAENSWLRYVVASTSYAKDPHCR